LRPGCAAAGSLLLAALLVASGCGYALEGRGIVVDPTIKTVGVPLFDDDTGKPALDQKVTEEVIAELLRRGRFNVIQGEVGVDALVEGRLRDYRAVPVGFSDAGDEKGSTEASRYAITLTASVVYGKVGETVKIWENTSFSFRDEFDLGDDPEEFFDREEQAIDRLVEQFARNLVSAMLEAF
jgi:hypothetical protein